MTYPLGDQLGNRQMWVPPTPTRGVRHTSGPLTTGSTYAYHSWCWRHTLSSPRKACLLSEWYWPTCSQCTLAALQDHPQALPWLISAAYNPWYTQPILHNPWTIAAPTELYIFWFWSIAYIVFTWSKPSIIRRGCILNYTDLTWNYMWM